MKSSIAIGVLLLAFYAAPAVALDWTNVTFQIFQFPADQIPRIDGSTEDWSMVPKRYMVGSDQLVDDEGRHANMDPANLDVKVRVGWVKGMDKLYFLYEAYDDYWDLSRQPPDVWQCFPPVRLQADAAGTRIERVHRSTVDTPGGGHGPPPGRVQGFV